MSDRSSVEQERSSAENVTIIAETFSDNAGATVSSIKSEDSTEQLICKTPQQKSVKRKVDTHAATLDRRHDAEVPQDSIGKSLEASLASDASARSDENSRSKVILFLGLGQLVIGIAMVVFGALVIVHNSSLSRVGAGLWAGCIAVATGVVGVLAGINDCYGLYGARRGRSGAFLTAFLALSLASLAAGNMAAVLAGTGVYRDTHNNRMPSEIDADFEDEQEAWTPVLTNIGLIIISSLHCLLAVISIYHASRRVCPCFQTKEPYNHNQFDPTYTSIQAPYVIQVSEKKSLPPKSRGDRKNHELCKDLEKKLTSDSESLEKKKVKKRKMEEPKDGHYDSANSKERLVTSWLGRHHTTTTQGQQKKERGGGVRKMKIKSQRIMLLPHPPPLSHSHPASTLGRSMPGAVPLGVVAVGGRYHTLPLPPAPVPPHYRPTVYYPVHEVRGRRRRSPRSGGGGGGNGGGGGGGAERRVRVRGAARDSQLTRSLERIHRKSRDKQVSDAELKRTYTGLDRTIAEQFIAVCDETRSHPAGAERPDSSGFDTASSDCHSNRF